MGYSFFIGSAGRVLAAPDGNWQYLSPEPMHTPSHYQNRSGKFLKGVGKLLSRSFLTKKHMGKTSFKKFSDKKARGGNFFQEVF